MEVKEMKKKVILLIVLIVISVGLLCGCTRTTTTMCGSCQGTGTCSSCQGAGFDLSDSTQPCPTCGESGMCTVCGGTGEVETQKMPGFEFVFAICAVALILVWKRKRGMVYENEIEKKNK